MAVFFILFQMLYLVSVSYPLADMGGDTSFSGVTVREVRGYSALISVVCDNTLMSLLKIAELANLVSTKPSQPQQPEPQRKDTTNTDSTGLLPFSRIIYDSRSSFETFHSWRHSGGSAPSLMHSAGFCLLLFLLAGVFLFLLRLKLHFLRARSSIDDSIITVLTMSCRNPHFASYRMRVFLLFIRLRNSILCVSLRLFREILPGI